MRIALVSEDFTPGSAPTAVVARALVRRLVDQGHDVTVFTAGRGHSTFGGARVFRASRATPVSAFREALTLSRPDVVHLLEPHRLSMKCAEAAEQLGLPTLYVDPRSWQPGVDADDHHPGLRDEALHDRWARVGAPDGGLVVAGYVGDLRKRKVVARLSRTAALPGVRLVALGDGPGTGALREAGAKVVPTPSALERALCVASFDVLLQPRKRVVFAPVVREALASGVPVVAFGNEPSAAVVRHEHNGLLVDVDRGGRQFARSVARVAASPDLRAQLALHARASVLDRPWDVAAAELVERHYAPVLAPDAALATAF